MTSRQTKWLHGARLSIVDCVGTAANQDGAALGRGHCGVLEGHPRGQGVGQGLGEACADPGQRLLRALHEDRGVCCQVGAPQSCRQSTLVSCMEQAWQAYGRGTGGVRSSSKAMQEALVMTATGLVALYDSTYSS